ncbi:MAG: class I SAM-dependent methyltransferase [Planctomycetota bacterium]|nr:class I SAM-dependent methyltransferase [Planctomycetota bacterium]
MGKTKRKKKGGRTAANSDRHILYEMSVQEPLADCEFIEQAWRDVRGRRPRHLREDFCGTAIAAIEWVKRRKSHTAIGVDLDADVLAIARKRMTRRLKGDQCSRIKLLEEDVTKVKTRKVDTVVAMNFSYFIFKTRRKLKGYFRNAREALVDDGLFIIDVYGGSDSFLEENEKREVDGFTYVWDTEHYNPITGDVINHIHFRFPDGSKIKEAFTYEWRLWTIPELRELLMEAGFKRVDVYWEGTDEDGEGDGEYSVSTRGEACEGWVSYLVAAV